MTTAAICMAAASWKRSRRIGSRERSRSDSSKSSTRRIAARKRAKAVSKGRMRALSAGSAFPLRLDPMSDTCRIVALGGLGEVGKNLTVYECDGSIVVVDAGLAFPRDEHLGVDLVLPDFSYLRDRASSIKAVILTPGPGEYVGSLPDLLRA